MTNRAGEPGNSSCRLCLRDLFVYGHGESRYCDSCLDMLRRQPRKDPARIPNGRTERLPQELPNGAAWTRDTAGKARCSGAPGELFEPLTLTNDTVPEHARQAAAVFCAHCPILDECRAEADAHQFLGLWGGQWRRYGDKRGYLVRDLRPKRAEAAA